MNAICQNFFHLPQLSKYGNLLNDGTHLDIFCNKGIRHKGSVDPKVLAMDKPNSEIKPLIAVQRKQY